MQTQTLVGLKAQLPGRVPSSRVQRAAAIRCENAQIRPHPGRGRRAALRRVWAVRGSPLAVLLGRS